jgi:hypothetical protein
MLLTAAYSGQIALARDELRLLLFGLRATYIFHENTRGKNAFGLGVAAEFATMEDIKLQALVILLFATVIRNDPQNNLREVLSAIKAKRVNHGRPLDLSPPNE